ncbi:hypothetical protein A1Q1_03087 [Trichosporon asahii var. asahii CBS 2479]|uniref:Uncharacterized protein n=1 Tax=Trichosporon asahii var. asahii (strain ATCC 90039 / CBS 2479 / JCM 2466 / KCTC 7840 / NBRC 103889/ NCYC 2677 / UAMH 7654) TaxID=1186058 RepID=J5RH90_TRIAS|nr:hypothetical protein A1Q1_03087 [Trichosporon asahii var. asahii CBS 2479]EJT52633.1 hypothetical protein A1Q1_03087 [Trichosporon asahii var. asahii CBS 2479]
MPGISSPSSQTRFGHRTHSIIAPECPWHHIGVDWLSNLVPCPSCQTVEDYLRSLLRPSIPNLIQIIEQYEASGKKPAPTCQCAASQPQPAPTEPAPLPEATCLLNEDDDWVFNIVTPSTACVQWIKDRLQETYIEQTLRTSWKRYMNFFDVQNKLWATANTGFTPWAQFPRKKSPLVPQTVSDITFGPCELGPKQHRSLNIVLKWAQLDTKVSEKALRWLYYLDRPAARPVEYNRGPPLTPSIGTMVRQPDFQDEDALALWANCTDCEVLVNTEADLSWGNFERSAEKTRQLQGLQGVTVLFLGCVVINDNAACSKLLLMRETGYWILEDLIRHDFLDVLDGRFDDCLLPLLQTAMTAGPEWSLQELCEHLSRWFIVWTRLSGYDGSPSHSHTAFKALLVYLSNIATSERGSGARRLFAPQTSEGWEDTADVAAMGTVYGCAVGTLTMLSLKSITERMQLSDVPPSPVKTNAESPQLGSKILQAILSSNQDTCGADESVLMGGSSCKLPPQYHGDVLALSRFLQHLRASVNSVALSYQSVLDGERLVQAIQAAFSSVVAKHVSLENTSVHQFFGTEHMAPMTGTGHHASFRDELARWYNAGFAVEAFRDLASLEVCNHSEEDLRTDSRFHDCWAGEASRPTRSDDEPPAADTDWQPSEGHQPLGTAPVVTATPWIPRTSTPELMLGSAAGSVTPGSSGGPVTPSTSICSRSPKSSLAPETLGTRSAAPPSRLTVDDGIPPHNVVKVKKTEKQNSLMAVVESASSPEVPARKVMGAAHPGDVEPSTANVVETYLPNHPETITTSPPVPDIPGTRRAGSLSEESTQGAVGHVHVKPGWKALVFVLASAVSAFLVGMCLGAYFQSRNAYSTLPSHHHTQMPAARVRDAFTWGGSTTYSRGSIVCIVGSPMEGFYEVLNIKGDRDVSTLPAAERN